MKGALAIFAISCSATQALTIEIPTQDRVVYELRGAEVFTIPGPPNPETYRGGLVHQESRNSATYTLPNATGGPYDVTWTWNDPPALLEVRDLFAPPGPLQGSYEFTVQASFTRAEGQGFIGPTLGLTAVPCCGEGVVLRPDADSLTIDYWFSRHFLADQWMLSVRISDGNSFSGTVVTYTYDKREIPAVPSSGDCCAGRDGPGCAIADCESCVCSTLSGCCESSWDDGCADRAQGECAAQCLCPRPPPEDCCESMGLSCRDESCPGCGFESCRSCVCGIAPSCCSATWDGFCADLARGQDCADACLCEARPPEDCCSPNQQSECGFEGCAQCVCERVPECCDPLAPWEDACAAVAREQCSDDCLCAAPPPADCCASAPQLGCAFESCEECVCGTVGGRPECCEDPLQPWDEVCAEAANLNCAEACLCDSSDTLPKSCCEPLTDQQCAFDGCRSCVGGFRPECASGPWTATCAQTAIDECAEQCFCEKTATPDCCVERRAPGCGDQACQSCVCDRDGSCCGDRWSAACVAIAETDCADRCACETIPPPECCADHSGTGCALSACEECVCNDLGLTSCCDGEWSPTCAVAAQERCNAQCLCDPGVRIDCCGDPLQSDNPGEAGCTNRSCELCVCSDAEWEHCCSDSWSSLCAAEARQRCARLCGCEPPKPSCCRPRQPGEPVASGCENGACALCVCAIPGFEDCCTEAWTEKCAIEARTIDFDAPCLQVCGCVDLPEQVDCCVGGLDPQAPPGCTNDACARCVCDDADLFGCCSEQWGEECRGEVSRIGGRCDHLCCQRPPVDCCGTDGFDPNAAPGCSNDACARCICDVPDLFHCCSDEWGPECTGAATTFDGRCADVCGCSEPQDCCSGSDGTRPGCALAACERCVCDDPAFFHCCESGWTAGCTARALSRECAQSCGCSLASTCCEGPSRFGSGRTPFCFDRPCETCVCGALDMEECCTGPWTRACSEAARSHICRRACQCRRSFRLVATTDPASDRVHVADAADFPWFGVIQIGDEQLRYFGIEQAADGAAVLLVVERGYAGTPIGQHGDGDQITLISGIDTAGPGDASCDGAIDQTGREEILGLAGAVFTISGAATCPFADANGDGEPSAADLPALLRQLRL